MKKLTVKEFQEKLNNIYPNEKLEALDWGGDKVNTHVKCLICGTVYMKKGGYFLDKRKKSICKICFPTQPNQLKENYEFDQTDPDCIISFGTYTRIFEGKFEFTYDFVLIERDGKYVEMYEKQN